MGHPAKTEYIDIFLVYGLSVCLIIVFSIVHFTPFLLQHVPKKAVNEIPKKIIQVPVPILFNKQAFDKVQVEGKAYIVYDLVNHEVIASKNELTVLPLASVTKVMMAVSSILHKSKDESVVIRPSSIEGSYDLGLKNKQVWKLSELLKYTLIFSSNDGAEAIADNFGGKEAFVAQMNTDAKILGLNLFFTDPAGRDIDGAIGGKGTVMDVAKLFGVALQSFPEILDTTTKKRGNVTASGGKITGIPNTNQEIETLPGAQASKTGYTEMAGGNLGVIVDVSIGHPVVIVVLGSTREGRFKDMSTLYKALRGSMETTHTIPNF